MLDEIARDTDSHLDVLMNDLVAPASALAEAKAAAGKWPCLPEGAAWLMVHVMGEKGREAFRRYYETLAFHADALSRWALHDIAATNGADASRELRRALPERIVYPRCLSPGLVLFKMAEGFPDLGFVLMQLSDQVLTPPASGQPERLRWQKMIVSWLLGYGRGRPEAIARVAELARGGDLAPWNRAALGRVLAILESPLPTAVPESTRERVEILLSAPPIYFRSLDFRIRRSPEEPSFGRQSQDPGAPPLFAPFCAPAPASCSSHVAGVGRGNGWRDAELAALEAASREAEASALELDLQLGALDPATFSGIADARRFAQALMLLREFSSPSATRLVSKWYSALDGPDRWVGDSEWAAVVASRRMAALETATVLGVSISTAAAERLLEDFFRFDFAQKGTVMAYLIRCCAGNHVVGTGLRRLRELAKGNRTEMRSDFLDYAIRFFFREQDGRSKTGGHP